MVKPISPRALERRLEGRHALLDVAHDVLQHDDGVVDDEADGERQAEQRDVVDREAERVHRAEGRDERDRHGDARDEGRRQAAEEEEDHQDHEADRQHAA